MTTRMTEPILRAPTTLVLLALLAPGCASSAAVDIDGGRRDAARPSDGALRDEPDSRVAPGSDSGPRATTDAGESTDVDAGATPSTEVHDGPAA